MEEYMFRGEDLRVEDVLTIRNKRFSLDKTIWQNIATNRQALENLLSDDNARYYGINTGFGALYSVKIPHDKVSQLQTNLLRSHACGTGPAAPPAIVRLTLLLKIISLSYARSGVRPEVVRGLLDLLNHDILPVLPTMGSLGASGDLAPLAHLCLPLIGEGEVVYRREQMPAARALALAGLSPLDLAAKEGLALINGTQYSLAWLVYAIGHARQIAQVADICAAMSMDGYDAHPAFLDKAIHEVRRQHGQICAAAHIRQWLEGSTILHGSKTHLQDPYSFRCAPQVHGASRDAIDYVTSIANREINAVTDNPLVIEDEEGVRIVSGGNFHAQPLALSSDFLAIALSEYGSISERRSYLMLNGQRNLPFALANDPGLESGMMICQYTAAALVNRNKGLCYPASVDTIVTSGGQEDHVSMAANAGIKLFEVVNNTWKLLAIEWLIACQALEYRRPLTTSPQLEVLHARYRTKVAPLTGDREYASDFEVTDQFLRSMNIEMS